MSNYQKTHEMVFLDSKPSEAEIKRLNLEYYQLESLVYDEFNEKSSKRKSFMESVDRVIADRLRSRNLNSLLSVACGTGMREERIAQLLRREVGLSGVDISQRMCDIASARKLRMLCGEWPNGVDRAELKNFDCALMLNYIGLSPTRQSVQVEFRAIHDALKPGGIFIVDAYNIEDETEWGPEIKSSYIEQNLEQRGYSLGDVFFKRIDRPYVAFFHYYSTSELREICESQGFGYLETIYVNASDKPGAVTSANCGNIVMVLERPE